MKVKNNLLWEQSPKKNRELVNKRGFPQPKKAKCFQCKGNLFIKFVISQHDYSKKNNWNYWSGQETQNKICNACLKALYYNKPIYWKTITNLKKRNLLKSYINIGHIS